MEQLLTKLNYNNPDFYNNNVENVYPKLSDFFEKIRNSANKNKQLIDLISLLIKLTSQASINPEDQNNKEMGHYYLIKEFLDQIDLNWINSADDINAIIKLFQQISNYKVHNRIQITIVGSLIRFLDPNDIVKKLGPKTYSSIVQATKIKFKFSQEYLNACYGEDLNEPNMFAYSCRNNESFTTYKSAMENFFDLERSNFDKVLPDIQGFYEYILFYCLILGSRLNKQ